MVYQPSMAAIEKVTFLAEESWPEHRSGLCHPDAAARIPGTGTIYEGHPAGELSRSGYHQHF